MAVWRWPLRHNGTVSRPLSATAANSSLFWATILPGDAFNCLTRTNCTLTEQPALELFTKQTLPPVKHFIWTQPQKAPKLICPCLRNPRWPQDDSKVRQAPDQFEYVESRLRNSGRGSLFGITSKIWVKFSLDGIFFCLFCLLLPTSFHTYKNIQ